MIRALRHFKSAWTISFGLMTLLLIGLWMRSYSRWDHFNIRLPGPGIGGISSERGVMGFGTTKTVVGFPKTSLWQFRLGRPVDYTRKEYDSLIFGFGYQRYESSAGGAVFFPHLFGSILAAAAAALPWLPRRFGLWTLLVVYTIVAVALAVVVHFLQAILHQAAAR